MLRYNRQNTERYTVPLKDRIYKKKNNEKNSCLISLAGYLIDATMSRRI